MDLIQEHNKRLNPMRLVTGVAMKVHSVYHAGLLESAYEAAMEHLLKKDGHLVERQKFLHIYWEDEMLDQTYKLDLVVDGIIVELKAVKFVSDDHRRQLWNYMRLTHTQYGMLINFGSKSLYSEWYELDVGSGDVNRVKLL